MGADPAQGWACKQSSDMKRPKGPLLTAAPPEARKRAEAFAKANRPRRRVRRGGTILRPESVGFGQKPEGVGSVGGSLLLRPPACQRGLPACAHAPSAHASSVKLSHAHTPPDATKPLPAIDPTVLQLTNSYNLRRPQGPLSKFSQKTPNTLLTKGEIGGIIHINIHIK